MRTTNFLFFFFLQVSFAQIPFVPISEPFVMFATHLDVHGNDVIVSSGPFGPTTIVGKTFIFTREGGSMVEKAALFPADATNSDQFGNSVSIWGEFAAIGAPANDAAGVNAGAVYIYRNIGGAWEFFQKITANDAEPGDRFGDVKLIEGQLFVGASDDEPVGMEATSNEGSIYVYDFNGTQWNFSQKLIVAGSSQLGGKIEVENSRLVVRGNNPSATTFYTFQFNTSWQNEGELTIPMDLSFGNGDFSLTGDKLYLINEAPEFSGEQIFPFSAVGNQWIADTPLDITVETGANDHILSRIEVNGDRMFIGSTNYMLLMPRKFPVFYYHKIGAEWVCQSTYYGDGQPMIDDYFGAAMASGDNFLVIGATQQSKAYYVDFVPLAVSDYSLDSIKIFPNPADDVLFIENSADGMIDQIEIFSVTGSRLDVKKENLNQLAVESLHSGIYFLKLHFADGKSSIHKIVKK